MTVTAETVTTSTPSTAAVDAARHVCQEARVVLTSLRGGPPHVARGELAQDLIELRDHVQRNLDTMVQPDEATAAVGVGVGVSGSAVGSADANAGSAHPPSPAPTSASPPAPKTPPTPPQKSAHPRDPGLFAGPFLQVIMDPRAAGPHTLVALRAIFRLLERGTFRFFHVSLEALIQGILACKFEQTDAGADEAVEMAIADVLCLLVRMDDVDAASASSNNNTDSNDTSTRIQPSTLMDAFNTIFVTRNTFVHSPALCYHFEDVLTVMVTCVFQTKQLPAKLVLEFLVNQLLHTPLVGGDGLDESTREAQTAHDATRVMCLRLTRTALRTGWAQPETESLTTTATSATVPTSNTNNETKAHRGRTLLQIIQDDLCLSLLMTGQAIWAYHDESLNISPGFVSLEVLTEICETLSTLWNTLSLRSHLIAQFETIFTGFYQRALVLLRKRRLPTDSLSFNANLNFDAEVEIILESLVDILCLHDHRRSIADGDGGSLETLFAYYDCHLRRSDVAIELMVEICRCCGGAVDEEGEAVLTPVSSVQSMGPTPPETVSGAVTPQKGVGTPGSASTPNTSSLVKVSHPWRQVPAHLKELCAQALMGGMKCLFRDDKPSAETMLERSKRKKSIMPRQVDGMDDGVQSGSSHLLRDVKSKKRLMRKAARIFNQKASRGIEFLLDTGLVSDPVTPESVAAFLRNGIVVGLDKKAVGAYLGEAGKPPAAGKSPPGWERDWFHKDVLKIYCSLFRFEHQSLIDGLRMFLACFRLPGEAQQIDRILQAFSDSCGQVCEESSYGGLNIFSDDPKRASDTAYLLSFSIIMLNTDRHNDNIREDRKMKAADFVKNNSDYGQDITAKGKELPPEYLIGIYHSINDEEIRTEGEGADGAMTVERWKDVLRGSTEDFSEVEISPSSHDAEDLTELVVEHVWKPIMSAVAAFWGVTHSQEGGYEVRSSKPPGEGAQSSMLGVQGARLGMDMSLEMIAGVRQLGRIDLFRKIFTCVCGYTGLLGDYNSGAFERIGSLTNSVEAQSAIIVALRAALDAGSDLDIGGWKRIWSMLFELRDLKMIAGGNSATILRESDPDLLNDNARRDWTMCLIKGDMEYAEKGPKVEKEKRSSILSSFGRALFGVEDPYDNELLAEADAANVKERTVHGKEDLVVWDESALSDLEDVVQAAAGPTDSPVSGAPYLSAGAQFEGQLIRESIDMSRQMEMPVTGLERADETRRYHVSPRARVRGCLRNACNLNGLVSDSRFMDDPSILNLLEALVELVAVSSRVPSVPGIPPPSANNNKGLERSYSDVSVSTADFLGTSNSWSVPLSPASEAFAEILICEIALKNKDRLKALWTGVLQDHYLSKLTSILVNPSDGNTSAKIPVDPGLEKRVTGLLRLSICAIHREDLVNEVLSSWKYLLPMNDQQHGTSPLRALDRHMGEGLWRMISDANALVKLDDDGWGGLVSLLRWCAKRAGMLKPIPSAAMGGPSGLAEDDPALQAYRSLHLLINTAELDGVLPCSVVESVRLLAAAGHSRRYPQLSIASLDLLHVLHEKKIALIDKDSLPDTTPAFDAFWSGCWMKIVEGMAEAAEKSSDSVSKLPIGHEVIVSRVDSCFLLLTLNCSIRFAERPAALTLDVDRSLSG
jgi:hypothetical protein